MFAPLFWKEFEMLAIMSSFFNLKLKLQQTQSTSSRKAKGSDETHFGKWSRLNSAFLSRLRALLLFSQGFSRLCLNFTSLRSTDLLIAVSKRSRSRIEDHQNSGAPML